ncbi:MAG TPA: alpha/beta hydrolase-fold protein [Pyrinomonadaceae bacterium]
MKISLAKLGRTPAFAIAVLAVVLSAYSFGQAVQEGKLIRETVHGRSLENTVTGESADRNVSIYLPPSYDSSSKRYPVVFLLHGITDTDRTWTRAWSSSNDGYATLQDVMDRGIAEGRFGEMIVVMPDQNTKAFGSFYVNSTVTGNWEDFTAKELVAYVDTKYRTLARSEKRGITGHSMGGYGALSIAMNHPDVFSVAYGMNPALIGWAADLTAESPGFASIYKFRTLDELMQSRELYTIAVVTVGQAFSPNPKKAPFYTDFPYEVVDGKLRPSQPGFSRWESNFLVNKIKDKTENLLKLRGIRFDSGYEDEFKFIPVNSRAFSAELTKHGIDHKFEEYNGDHRNRMWSRRGRLYNEVLPYFWLLLGPQPEM